MMNPFKTIKWNPGPAERRSFARSLIIGFPCIALLFLLAGYFRGKGWDFSLPLKIGGVGAAVGLLFLLVPGIVRPFYVVWYAVACCIGLVVGNVVLALVYYALFTGVGLLMRAIRRGGLQKSFDKSAASHWRDAGPQPEPRRYYSQF
jgi:hypothetical protein